MDRNLWDVAIIGSGPAGLTAAIYITRGAASTVVFGGEMWGGQLMLTSTVDNFPGFPQGIDGPELMSRMKDQAIRFGAEFIPQSVTSVDFSKRPFKLMTNSQPALLRGRRLAAKSVIIATGAEHRWLEVPGERELIGRGISTCASCDAPFFKNKTVAVVGGGDTAMEEASVLTKYASKIYLIHRRDRFRASPAMQQRIKNNPKVEIIWSTLITKVSGKEKLESLSLQNTQTSKTSQLKVNGLFVAIGHRPLSDLFKGQLEMDEKGYIKVFDGTKTSAPGVFVAGDVHDYKYKQAITAAGFGCMAALDCLKYLEDNV